MNELAIILVDDEPMVRAFDGDDRGEQAADRDFFQERWQNNPDDRTTRVYLQKCT